MRNAVPKGGNITDLKEVGSLYCPAELIVHKGYYYVKPPLFTSDELAATFELPKNYPDQYRLLMVDGLGAKRVSLHNADEDRIADTTIGYLQPQTGCCGAAFLALPGFIHADCTLLPSIEVLALLSKAYCGCSFISCIIADYQLEFIRSAEAVGFVKRQSAKSKKTGMVLNLYAAPETLNWKHIPESVIAKSGVK